MIIDPSNLTGYSAYDLLRAAAGGYVAMDQRLIHALVDKPSETLPDIVRFAAEVAKGPISLDADLVSIFHYLKAPAGLPFLIHLVRRDPTEIPDDLVETFVAIGEPAVEPLLQLHSEVGDADGAEIAFLLAGLNVKDPRILELLLRRLDVDWTDALFHLEVYGDPSALPALKQRLGSTANDEAELDLRDTIRELDEAEPETEAVAAPSFDIWDLYAPEDEPLFEILTDEERIEFFDASNEQLRAGAVRSFFGQEFSLQTRAKLLERATRDESSLVRAAAWRNFFDFIEDEPELRRTLLDRLDDPKTDAVERSGLAIALAQHSDQPKVRAAILAAVEDPATRARGLEAVWRSFDENFRELPPKFIEDPDLEVQRNAIWGIGYLKITNQAHLLPKFFENENLRPDAMHNYAIAAPGPTNRNKILSLYTKIGEMAQGFGEGETQIVQAGLDVRLMNAGLPPVFETEEDELDVAEQPAVSKKAGRNDPCPCGSGKKYKKCCGA